MRFINFITRHLLVSSAILLLVLVAATTVISFFNHLALKKRDKVSEETRQVIRDVDQVWNQVVRNVDIGMRGYVIMKFDSNATKAESDAIIQPMRQGIRDLPNIIRNMKTTTQKQNFPNPKAIDTLDIMARGFIKKTEQMVAMIDAGDTKAFFAELRADPGKQAWMMNDQAARKIRKFETDLDEDARKSYEQTNRINLIFQIILGCIAIPTLGFMIFKINHDRKARKDLFLKLDKNNKEFLFNPGGELGKQINENQVIENSISNFKAATEFISEVSNGNFGVDWNGITSDNEKLNTKNLAGELIQMRDRMKTIKAQDEIRNWTAEGLAKFSDVIRQNQQNIQGLSYDILVYITKYMNAQQGCLFVLTEDLEDGHELLEMTACYAFNRKKHITKKLEIGQGVIGQAYLEGSSVLLTDVPNGYTEITSGLGEGTPTCILVVPMKYNEKIEAVIEIAGFEKFEKYQVEFMEKVGEITASTLGSVKNTEKMQHLVNQFKSQTEQLKAQEEELRQNMEEMEATQEALRRQDKEY
jgi:CHASE3 domain sensor protein